jgi:hypothetical protein
VAEPELIFYLKQVKEPFNVNSLAQVAAVAALKDRDHVKKTVDQFAKAVDAIEDHEFAPPALETLEERNLDGRSFAQRVCRNCDVRFSCASYQAYARKYKDRNWRKFASFYDSPTDEGEDEERTEASIGSVASAMEAAGDL